MAGTDRALLPQVLQERRQSSLLTGVDAVDTPLSAVASLGRVPWSGVKPEARLP
jgi:hypothetical protein